MRHLPLLAFAMVAATAAQAQVVGPVDPGWLAEIEVTAAAPAEAAR